MKRRQRRIAVAALSCIAAGGISAEAASSADIEEYPSNVTINYTADVDTTDPYNEPRASFYGRVASNKKVCRKGRTVTIKNNGTGRPVGSDRTDGKGRYSVDAGVGAAPGNYRPKVATKTITKKDGAKIICKGIR